VVEAEVEEAGVDVVDVAEAVEEASLLLTLLLLAAAVGKGAARVEKRSRSLSTSLLGRMHYFTSVQHGSRYHYRAEIQGWCNGAGVMNRKMA
jgi:hypothetical protein